MLTSDPENANALAMLGTIQLQRGNSEESIRLLEKAITINPHHAKAYSNRGFALSNLGKYHEALASYDKAIAIDSNHTDAYLNKSLLKLLLEDYQEGWELYEWRKKTDMGIGLARVPDKPLWLGKESLEGKTILLYTEQGLGDAIQFCRYVPMVEALGAKVILTVPSSLVGLMSTLKGKHLLLGKGTYNFTFDFHCPLLSLPLAFGTTTITIPAKVPYLSANQENLKIWQDRLGTKSKPRIGLVWSGSATHVNDHNRSIPLNMLAPLLQHDFDYYSIQKEIRPGDQEVLAHSKIISHVDNLKNFADTAALISEMDLVISVDTSVTHLAGALGKPVWVLLPFIPDFRWMLEREDSTWYPTARLFRQVQIGDWAGVIAKVATALTVLKL